MKTILALSLITHLVFGAAVSARARQGNLPPATKIAELAKRPLSPGVVALLFVHAHEPEATKLLEAALIDAKPEVRATAARTLAGFNAAPFLPALRRALAAETDLEAGREQLRALASLVGPAEDVALVASARRIGDPLVGDLAVTFARVRGAASLDLYFSTMRRAPISDGELYQFLRLATRGRRGATADAFAKALAAGDERAVSDLLSIAADREGEIGEAAIVPALGSSVPAIRTDAAWSLAERRAAGAQFDAKSALDELARGEKAGGTGASVDDAFGTELLARMLGRAPAESAPWIASLQAGDRSRIDEAWVTVKELALLTPVERAAVEARDRERKRDRAEAIQRRAKPESGLAVPLRTVRNLPKGVGSDVLAAAKCPAPGTRDFALADVTYRGDGKPAHIEMVSVPSDARFRDAALALFVLSFAPDGEEKSPERVRLMVLFGNDFLLHIDERPVDRTVVTGPLSARVSGGVLAGKATRRVQPPYPEEAKRNNLTGTVIIEVIVDEEGYVTGAEVAQGTSSVLDLAAMVAALQWRFSPTLLSGKPVKVIGTVRFNFRQS